MWFAAEREKYASAVFIYIFKAFAMDIFVEHIMGKSIEL
jgi:hypothetical protein